MSVTDLTVTEVPEVWKGIVKDMKKSKNTNGNVCSTKNISTLMSKIYSPAET